MKYTDTYSTDELCIVKIFNMMKLVSRHIKAVFYAHVALQVESDSFYCFLHINVL